MTFLGSTRRDNKFIKDKEEVVEEESIVQNEDTCLKRPEDLSTKKFA